MFIMLFLQIIVNDYNIIKIKRALSCEGALLWCVYSELRGVFVPALNLDLFDWNIAECVDKC